MPRRRTYRRVLAEDLDHYEGRGWRAACEPDGAVRYTTFADGTPRAVVVVLDDEIERSMWAAIERRQ